MVINYIAITELQEVANKIPIRTKDTENFNISETKARETNNLVGTIAKIESMLLNFDIKSRNRKREKNNSGHTSRSHSITRNSWCHYIKRFGEICK